MAEAGAEGAMDVGSRLELFVDDALIERLEGARRVLNRPTEREAAMVLDAPWEGNNCGYVTVFPDDGLYRMYYRGRQLDWQSGKVAFPHEQVYCYAESSDGIHWMKPELGLIKFEGSKKNNIILTGLGTHNLTPFKDGNPACKSDERYKAVGGVQKDGGLFTFKSADGIVWSRMGDGPVITDGFFDSQNLAFWDGQRGEYREYHRDFRNFPHGRDIKTCTSPDFLNWTDPVWLAYDPDRMTELYTNQIVPYYRAPHIFLGFPTRYVTGRSLLTPLNEQIAEVSKRFGTDYSDTGFMTSRDGEHFSIWGEAFVRPGLVQKGRWVYGDNYQNWGIIETPADGAGLPNELSVYLTEGCWRSTGMALRRYTLRVDGFVSVQAPLSGGELITKPLVFAGDTLAINFSTSAAGSIRVEIQDDAGKAIEGFTLDECPEIFGDDIEHAVGWKSGARAGTLAGKPVRVRFALRDADLFSFRFRG